LLKGFRTVRNRTESVSGLQDSSLTGSGNPRRQERVGGGGLDLEIEGLSVTILLAFLSRSD
jgi:hypothetical protein